MMSKSECFTAYIDSLGPTKNPIPLLRDYGNRQKIEQVAKRTYKKIRRKTWVEDDKGNKIKTFGR